jgi:hypothetical protein
VSSDALEIILSCATFINGQLYSQTEDVDQEDARFDTLSCGFESGDNHPADAI